MQSMIKREISLSITAHSELVRQLLLDGLEVATHRRSKFPGNVYRADNRLQNDAIYYRNMRQNGHSTALRTVYSSPEFENIGVITVFTDSGQLNNFMSKVDNKNQVSECLFTEFTVERDLGNLQGAKIEVLVLHDYVSIDAIRRGWDLVYKIQESLPDLKLVVFLG